MEQVTFGPRDRWELTIIPIYEPPWFTAWVTVTRGGRDDDVATLAPRFGHNESVLIGSNLRVTWNGVITDPVEEVHPPTGRVFSVTVRASQEIPDSTGPTVIHDGDDVE